MSKMNFRNIYQWINVTMGEIEVLLDIHRIPYLHGSHELDSAKGGIDQDPVWAVITRQLTFPWCKGDVVVGTLHLHDNDLVAGIIDICDSPYPSIDTYNFPWDEGDITMFDSPAEFVKKLREYYSEVNGTKVKKAEV